MPPYSTNGRRDMKTQTQPRVGSIVKMDVYGHMVRVRVLAYHKFGTMDIERLSDGQCFRITGLIF